jgi:hypothetical protein
MILNDKNTLPKTKKKIGKIKREKKIQKKEKRKKQKVLQKQKTKF